MENFVSEILILTNVEDDLYMTTSFTMVFPQQVYFL